jgi:dTDP-4-dehydrorhamnose reductase
MGAKALQRDIQMVLRKIFLTGGSGTLGSELIKISKAHEVEFIAPASKYCDITNPYQIHNHIKDSGCDTIVHSAAITDVKATENDPSLAWDVNVLGTLNVLKSCKDLGKKLVFISTDYVFDGEKGNYAIDDPINPLSKYAKTKAGAELLVRTYENSLVIRTSFFGYDFPYEAAFVDQWSSKDYVDIIAPKVLEEILGNKTGVIHTGNERRSIYNIALDRNENVKKIYRKSVGSFIPRDISLQSGFITI